MATIYTLKETLSDRIKMLEAGLEQAHRLTVSDSRWPQPQLAYDMSTLEGRLEEARLMFRLVDQVAETPGPPWLPQRDYPLLPLAADEIEPEAIKEWGKQGESATQKEAKAT